MVSQKSIKAIGLLSGGLDSTIAVKMMIDQGVKVSILNLVTPFCTCTRKGCKHQASRVANSFNIPVKIISAGKSYIELIKNPKHGYGRNMNPCIDCRIFLFKKARKYMEEISAQFIFTGEVLGQRPMSQHKKALNVIEKESETEGLVVRPLSARLFPSTIPEENGWIDREKLLSIQGRRRVPQMELAKEFGITDYPCPAGGCRLTDPGFANRLRESFQYSEDTVRDIRLLRFGRHFRLASGAKVIVGRNEEENKVLKGFQNEDDILIEVADVGSPIVLLKKIKEKNDIKKATAFCIRYSDSETEEANIRIKKGSNSEELIKYNIL